MKNKKGQTEDMVPIIPFVFLLLIFEAGIGLGFSIFFNSEYDFKKVDAQILNIKIQDCLKLNEINLEQDAESLENELFKKCNLNNNTIKKYFTIKIDLNGQEKYNYAYDPTQCS